MNIAKCLPISKNIYANERLLLLQCLNFSAECREYLEKWLVQEEEQCIATKIWNFPIRIWQLFKECNFYCCLVISTLLNFKRSNHHFYCIFPALCFSKSRHRRCSVKNVFLKISQYSKKNTCVGVFFNKVAGLKTCNFIKKRLQHSCFPVIIAKFLRTSISKNNSERLLLFMQRLLLAILENKHQLSEWGRPD